MVPTLEKYDLQFPEPIAHASNYDKRESFYKITTVETSSPVNIDSELTLKNGSITSSITLSEEQPSNVQPLLFSCAAAIGGFLFGYDTGTISGFLEMISFQTQFGSYTSDGTYSIPTMRSGLIVSSICIGGLIGGFVSGKVAEMIGRRKTIMCFVVLYLAAVIQMVLAVSWIHYFISRVMLGAALGSYTLVIPMLLSESAPNNIREFSVSLFQLFITGGILIGNLVVYNSENLNDTGAYKVPLYISMAGSCVLFGVMAYIPESPRFLIAQNNIEEAKHSIGKFQRISPYSQYVAREVQGMIDAIEKDKAAGSASWGEIFTGKPRLCFRLFVGISIQLLQLLCGANYFFYYGTALFQQIAGSMSIFTTPIILSGVNFGCTLVGMVFVSKCSRRTVLLTGSAGMFVSFFLFSSFGEFLFHPNSNLNSDFVDVTTIRVGESMIFMACMFILFYAATWAPLSYVILAEIYPQRIRSKAMSVGSCSNWFLNFVVNLFTPFIVSKIGFGIGYIFSAFIFVGFFFTLFCVHETKGLTLEQTDEMYASHASAIQSSTKGFREEYIYKTSFKEVYP